MVEKLIEYCVKNRFLVVLLVLFGLAGAWYSIRNIPLDAIPDLSDTQVILFTEWMGRSPDLMEDQVTYPIVTAMLAAPKVTTVRGFSMFGLSFVYVLFEDGTDIYWARSRVLEYMSGIQAQLPAGVVPELGPDATGVGWVYEYALVDETGRHDLAQLRTFQDWYLRYWLESVEGVAEVASVGGFERQYQVEVDPNKLLAYNLPLKRIIQAIRRSNNDVGGRVVEMTGREYFVRGRGYIKSLDDLRTVVVGTDGKGTPILVRDVAQVKFGPDMRRGAADLDGKGEVVGGIVVMRYGENALKVIERVKAKLEELKAQGAFPEGVELVTTYDRSDLILRSIDTLKRTLLEEMIIVSLVILIFLLHVRSALVAIITLPIAVALSFVPMFFLGLSSNIMSLGGIAIAVGVMVDAAVVLIENAHKRLERAPPGADRVTVILEAAKEVGKPIFFSLLVVTVSFLPVFTLEGQSGRLFKPLAFTKTFAMFFAAILSVTLAPALMALLIRGRIRSEERHPISRFLIWIYRPFVRLALRFRWLTIAVAVIILAVSVLPFLGLGSEFMPPLDEGSLLYMPTTLPGISIEEARKILQEQDRILSGFPEVVSVFGKVGRAKTSTDPAPLSMIETTIMLKPKDEWRPHLKDTYDLAAEMDQALKFPGFVNSLYGPIKTRIDMQTTGIRTPIGIKIYGKDLSVIEKLGRKLEGILSSLPGTRSVIADRVTGGYFIDFTPRREEIARYGLTVEDVGAVVETAIGGMNIDTTVEGRERYRINVRYPRELRHNLDNLRRVLVPTPVGAQVPITQLADIRLLTGPPVIKDENGSLVGYVYVDITTRDIGGYVDRAKQVVNENLDLPAGYYMEWTGQYELLEKMRERMKTVLPVTLLLIVLLIYMNFKSAGETFIVMASVPFALVGSVWLMWALDYNLSVAVWVGIIALAGVAAETGIVMIVYLDEAFHRYGREGRMNSLGDLLQAVTEGAVLRVRPKLMTVMTTIMGLLPVMWSHGAGADTMKRIAAPMIGGLITSTALTLVIIPAVYTIWRRNQHHLPAGPPTQLPGAETGETPDE